MNSFISSLCNSLSFNNLWNIISIAVPIFAISVLFELGFNLFNTITTSNTKPDKDIFKDTPSDEEYDRAWNEAIAETLEDDPDAYDDHYWEDDYDYDRHWNSIDDDE